MGRITSSPKTKRSIPVVERLESVKQLIVENVELRNTAVELALQTSILRERLSGSNVRAFSSLES